MVQVWAALLSPEDERRDATERGLLLTAGYTPSPYPGSPEHWPHLVRFDNAREAEAFLTAEFNARYSRLKNLLPPSKRGTMAPQGRLDAALVRQIEARRAELRQAYLTRVGRVSARVASGRNPTTSAGLEETTKRGVRHTQSRASKRGPSHHTAGDPA